MSNCKCCNLNQKFNHLDWQGVGEAWRDVTDGYRHTEEQERAAREWCNGAETNYRFWRTEKDKRGGRVKSGVMQFK